MVERRSVKNGKSDCTDGTICLNPDNRKRLITLEGWSRRWLTSCHFHPLARPCQCVCLFIYLHRQVTENTLKLAKACVKCETSQGTVVCNICRFLWLNLTSEHVRQAVRHDEPNTSYLERCNYSCDIGSGTEGWTLSWLDAGLCKAQNFLEFAPPHSSWLRLITHLFRGF